MFGSLSPPSLRRKPSSFQPDSNSSSHWPCTFCRQIFSHKTTLLLHMKDLHGATGSMKCTVCGKMFSSHGNLKRHQRSHPGADSRFQCQLCGKRLTTKVDFEGHMNLHAGVKPFSCHKCDKSFSNEKNMLYHIKHNCP